MNKKGFTLIELLAVIVILGIILGIAVPSAIGIIDKSKKDSHVKNAQIMVNTVKNIVSSNQSLTLSQGRGYLFTLGDLDDYNFLPKPKNPDGDSDAYHDTNSFVVVVNDGGTIKYFPQLQPTSGTARGIPLGKEASALTTSYVITSGFDTITAGDSNNIIDQSVEPDATVFTGIITQPNLATLNY